ncbi:MAG: patatin-like phospholipase family protein [Actinomycetota bacterium]|nr:patatin-like phospholipase family protein [Actinomycetota bacterium]
MAENNGSRLVAIACQGGGSHTAFTAGVLKKLLKEKGEGRQHYELVALSGTSGGAICALLTWYGLLTNDTNRAVELLNSFWRDNSAISYGDRLLNDWLLWTNRFFENTGGAPTLSPYYYPSQGQDLLRRMLEKHVDFQRANDLVGESSPMLLIGAANVLSGEFKAFNSRRDKINADVILASAAIPTLFKAVHTDGGVYWDGLFSQNPPVRELPDAKPNEIWVIQINPQGRGAEPKTMPHIMDRRNELAGNLSLYQETYFIRTVNGLVEKLGEGENSEDKRLLVPGEEGEEDKEYRHIDIKWIQMLRDLDTASKLNRDPSFIREMMAYGEEQAEKFLEGSLPLVGARTG